MWAYGPYCFAARYHELCALSGHFEFAKNRFFLFLLNFLKKFGQSIWAFLIIKLYGHYSASHVIWSLPPNPSGHPGAQKNCFLRFHLITGFKVENPYGPAFMNAAWTEFCVSCTFGHEGQLPPVVLHSLVWAYGFWSEISILSRFLTITGSKVDRLRLNFMDAFFEVGLSPQCSLSILHWHDTMIYLPLATILTMTFAKNRFFCFHLIVWYHVANQYGSSCK